MMDLLVLQSVPDALPTLRPSGNPITGANATGEVLAVSAYYLGRHAVDAWRDVRLNELWADESADGGNDES